ncbi:cyclase family protein [Clostridium oryzae]|uniref:Kynurenine formamidase n=1 Tax=Clostridium oryzae TaxID=1450648 RepID=A0A1V4I845_9CLOT|nr:cyclase family protein [Clostridium oryzae]OPJ56158.1 kynurenine formamidase [Clostridium oryzae]
MKIYDISMLIHDDMPVYNNIEDKKTKIQNVANYSNASHYESRIYMDIHCGTHFDAPLHMLENGESIEKFDLSKGITICKVFDLSNVEDSIKRQDIEQLDIKEGDFILFKTKNSLTETFEANFIFVEKNAAEFLMNKGVKGVGIDGLGIERSQPEHETHKLLLGSGIEVLEGLRLKDIKQGRYTLVALPLKIKGTEGAPARAVLLEYDEEIVN